MKRTAIVLALAFAAAACGAIEPQTDDVVVFKKLDDDSWQRVAP